MLVPGLEEGDQSGYETCDDGGQQRHPLDHVYDHVHRHGHQGAKDGTHAQMAMHWEMPRKRTPKALNC